jgi:hypothetical protein
MQVSVAEQDAPAQQQRWPEAALGPATISWLSLVIALPVAAWVLPARLPSVSWLSVLVILLTLVVAESYNFNVEFRRQSVFVSGAELAFVMALVELGPTWTALMRALVVSGVCLVQRFSLAKIVVNAAVAVIEVAVAVALLRLLPVEEVTTPSTWLSYLVAILVASMVGGGLIRLAIIATQGYPGLALWSSMVLAALTVTPMAVLVGLSILVLVHATPWSVLLILPLMGGLVLLYRRFAAVKREGEDLEKVYAWSRRSASSSTPSGWPSGCRRTSTTNRA